MGEGLNLAGEGERGGDSKLGGESDGGEHEGEKQRGGGN